MWPTDFFDVDMDGFTHSAGNLLMIIPRWRKYSGTRTIIFSVDGMSAPKARCRYFEKSNYNKQ